MKIHVPFSGSVRRVVAAWNGGFTLAELLVSIAVFTFLIGGVISAHLYGLSMFHITETTLSATDEARKTIGQMTDEIRTCNAVRIGNVSNGVFSAMLDGEIQQGSGLVIFPTTNAAKYVMYFVNPADASFRRTTSTPGSAVVVANTVTNKLVFRAQDYAGTLLTNNGNNRVIHVNLEFYQPKRHRQIADYYKLETSVTRRGE